MPFTMIPSVKNGFKRQWRRNRELANITSRIADILVAGVNFSVSAMKAHKVGGSSKSAAVGVLSAFHAYMTVSLPSGKRVSSYVRESTNVTPAREAIELMLAPKQLRAYLARRQAAQTVKQAYAKLDAYFTEHNISCRAKNALLLDIEAYRLANAYRHPNSYAELAENFSSYVDAACRQPIKTWRELAKAAKPKAKSNLRFIKKTRIIVADQEHSLLGIPLSLQQRDMYVDELCKEMRGLIPQLNANDLFEMRIFALKGKRRQDFLSHRSQHRKLQRSYHQFFVKMDDAFAKLPSHQRRLHRVLRSKKVQQQLLIYFELKRLRQQLGLHELNTLDKGASLDEIANDIFYYANYDAATRKINACLEALQEFTNNFSEAPLRTLNFIPARKKPINVLRHYALYYAKQDSLATLGFLSSNYIDLRMQELQNIHFHTVKPKKNTFPTRYLLPLLTTMSSATTNGLQTYSSLLSAFKFMNLPQLTWFMTICSGVFRAIRAKKQTSDIVSLFEIALDPDRGIHHKQPLHLLIQALSLGIAVALTVATGFTGYLLTLNFFTAYIPSITGAFVSANVVAFAVAGLALFSNISSINEATMNIHRLALKYLTYRKNFFSKRSRELNVYGDIHKPHWEMGLPVIAVLLSFATFALAFFTGVGSLSSGIVAGMTLLSLPPLIRQAQNAGRWLDHNNIKLFEAIGIMCDQLSSVAFPVALIAALTLLFSQCMLPAMLALSSIYTVVNIIRVIQKPEFRLAFFLTSFVTAGMVTVGILFPATLSFTLPVLIMALSTTILNPIINFIKTEAFIKPFSFDPNFRQVGKVIDSVWHRYFPGPLHALRTLAKPESPSSAKLNGSYSDCVKYRHTIKGHSFTTIFRNLGIAKPKHERLCALAEAKSTYRPLFHPLVQRPVSLAMDSSQEVPRVC